MAKKTARQILDRIAEIHSEEQSLMEDLEDIMFPKDIDEFEEDDFQDDEELN
ncbi:hypothetical protein [uncultured Mediterranean phage uvMED]|nr:hypothetical protein [uncultured Mediterranean phage uvMED]BAR17630.1 hypothetical protein [uncultured Mediterranean phage uvMED]BAR17681.1 hypothetical protein [uncultured Mediterranean phage uvMED]